VTRRDPDHLGVRGLPPFDLGTAINRVDHGFVALDRAWHIRFVNAAAARLLGREVGDLLGKSICAEFPTTIGSVFDLRFRQALETHQGVEYDEYSDLLGVWFSIRLYASADGVSLVFRDVTHLRTLAAERRELLVRLLGAENRERARIAADVHEDSVQALGVVSLRLQLLRHHLPSPSPEVESLLDGLGEQVTRATDRLRALLFSLEPTEADAPISESIRIQAAGVFDGSSTHWSVDDVDAGEDLPQAERGQALRITKEALTNVRAHGRASEVIVSLRGDEDGLEVVIADNGAAVDPATFTSAPGHRGLATMRDRAAAVGGWCSIEPSARGCTVRFYIPRVRPW
jgi:signal transduction histidine kinase